MKPQATITEIRAAVLDRGFFRITISTSWSSAVRNVISRSTETPSSLWFASADTFGWFAPSFSAAAACVSRRRAVMRAQPGRGERRQRQKEQQTEIGPHDRAGDVRDGVPQMVVIVPVDRDAEEAQRIGQSA
jgi:hypothetical protein